MLQLIPIEQPAQQQWSKKSWPQRLQESNQLIKEHWLLISPGYAGNYWNRFKREALPKSQQVGEDVPVQSTGLEDGSSGTERL